MTLLEKLEAATSGSRELSDECLLAWGYDPRHIDTGDPTRNLQHAVDAVPEGWLYTIRQKDAVLHPPPEDIGLFGKFNIGDFWSGYTATPALALCIAIEKARGA